MVRKCRGITEIAVMDMAQLGVKTRTPPRSRSRSVTASSETIKKRKLNDGELRISASYIQLRSRKINLQDTNYVGRTVIEESCSSPSSDDHDDRFSVSCCSSNGSSQDVNERIKLIDLEDESVEVELETTSTYYSCKEARRETTPSREKSYDLDSSTTTKPSTEANSRRRSTVEKMPTQSELEEFFSVGEKTLQKRFTDKYNYDIVKDEPMEGRYEWVRLRP